MFSFKKNDEQRGKTEQKEKTDKENQIMQDVQGLEKFELATTVGAGVILASTALEGIAPIFAISGVGIPIAIALFALGKAVKMYSNNKKFDRLLEDCKKILVHGYHMHLLIVKTFMVFFEQIKTKSEEKTTGSGETGSGGADATGQSGDSKTFSEMLVKMQKTTINKDLIQDIITKLAVISSFLKSISQIQKETNSNSISRNISRKLTNGLTRVSNALFADSNFRIISEQLLMLNCFFLMYDQEFHLIKEHYRIIIGMDNYDKCIEEINKTKEFKSLFPEKVQQEDFENILKEAQDVTTRYVGDDVKNFEAKEKAMKVDASEVEKIEEGGRKRRTRYRRVKKLNKA